jgi:hypothetical protein
MPLTKVSSGILAANAVNSNVISDFSISGNKLVNTAVTIGTYGGASQIPVVVVDQQGRVTSASNVAVSIPSGAYVTNSNNVILTTNTQITANCTILPNTGALTVGPVIIDANTEVTVSANARWVVL